jgi:RecJ-like exonuclease
MTLCTYCEGTGSVNVGENCAACDGAGSFYDEFEDPYQYSGWDEPYTEDYEPNPYDGTYSEE